LSTSQRLVPIARYDDPYSALIAQSKLSASGINSTLSGINHALTDPLISIAIGTTLFVPESAFARATSILPFEEGQEKHEGFGFETKWKYRFGAAILLLMIFTLGA